MSPAQANLILAAVAEMPADLRAIANLRVTKDISVPEIAAELGVPGEVVERGLAQAQTLLERALGPGYRIEYLRREEPARPARPAGPRPPATPADRPAADLPGPAQARPFLPPQATPQPAAQSPLDQLIAGSLAVLGSASGQQAGASEQAQKTLQEALNDAAEIFRLAAARISKPAEERSLRTMLAEEAPGGTTVVATGVADAGRFAVALQAVEGVRSVRIESVEDDRATLSVEADSMRQLMSGLISMRDGFRPRSLRVREGRIEVGLQPPAGAPARRGGQATFELGADAFFGARHYLTFGGHQGETHYHSWRVEVLIESDANSEEGVVVGFAEARGALETLVSAYNETLLNNVPPFDKIQPTAENLARVIYNDLKGELERESVRLKVVRVWESPTNHASYSEAPNV